MTTSLPSSLNMKVKLNGSSIVHQCRGFYTTYCGQRVRRRTFKIVAADQDATCKTCLKATTFEDKKREELKLKYEQRGSQGRAPHRW